MKRAYLGEFAYFPDLVHGIIKATYEDSPAIIQQSVIRSLHHLNSLEKKCLISDSSGNEMHTGKMGFEVGVAERVYFNYLDNKIVDELCKSVSNGKLYPILDFIIIVTYHYHRQGKNVYLNFDHNQLRFIFQNNRLELRLFHVKGIRRIPLDELIKQILVLINRKLKQQSLKPLVIEELNVL